MSVLVAIVLGIVQGVTEFLPVSSSGHLILFEKLFGLSGDNLAFNIVVHFGTLFAVVICYRQRLFEMLKKPLSKPVMLLALSCVPTVVIYELFRDFFSEAFSGVYLGICFFVTAVFLSIGDFFKDKTKGEIDYKSALVMGAFQGFAILPGVSRSGSTLVAGLVSGADKEKVADFSFLMSLPVIVGSLILEIFSGGFESIEFLPLLFGFVFSFISGYVAIKFMLKIVKNKSFLPFVIYLLVVGVFCFFV